MLTRASSSLATQSTLVLEHVMPELVREDVAKHEAPEGIARPRHDPFLAQIRARKLEHFPIPGRGCTAKSPRWLRLVVERDPSRPHEASEDQSFVRVGRGDQINRSETVVRILTEDLQRLANVGWRRWVVSPRRRATSTDRREPRPPRGSETPRIASNASGHRHG